MDAGGSLPLAVVEGPKVPHFSLAELCAIDARRVAQNRTLPIARLHQLHDIVRSMVADRGDELGPLDEIDIEAALVELIRRREGSAA